MSEEGTQACQPVNVNDDLHRLLDRKIDELLASEQSFLNAITKLTASDILTKQVTGNLDDVIELSKSITEKLLFWKTNRPDTLFSDCFSQLRIQLLSVYGTYCVSYDSRLEALQAVENDPDVKRYLEYVLQGKSEDNPGPSAQALLIMPVQRIMRYPLILNSISEVTNEEDFKKAYEIMKEIAEDIDKETQKHIAIDVRRHVSSNPSHSRISSYIFDIAYNQAQGDQVPITTADFQDILNRSNKMLERAKSLKKRMLKLHQCLTSVTASQKSLAETINVFYEGQATDSKVFLDTAKKVEATTLKDIQQPLDQILFPSLNELLSGFDNVVNLINRREELIVECKHLALKMNLGEDGTKHVLNHKLTDTRKTYESLNNQLEKELPIFLQHSRLILDSIARTILTVRKKFLLTQAGSTLSLAFSLQLDTTDVDIVASYELAIQTASRTIENFSFVQENTHSANSGVSALLRKVSSNTPDAVGSQRENLFTVVGGYECDTMTLKKGDVVNLLGKHGELWRIKKDGRAGTVPNCILRRYNPCIDKSLKEPANNEVLDKHKNGIKRDIPKDLSKSPQLEKHNTDEVTVPSSIGNDQRMYAGNTTMLNKGSHSVNLDLPPTYDSVVTSLPSSTLSQTSDAVSVMDQVEADTLSIPLITFESDLSDGTDSTINISVICSGTLIENRDTSPNGSLLDHPVPAPRLSLTKKK